MTTRQSYKHIYYMFIIIILLFSLGAFLSATKYLTLNVKTINISTLLLYCFFSYIYIYFSTRKDCNDKYCIDEKSFLVSILFIAFIIRLIVVLVTNYIPASDFASLYDGAIKLYNGNFAIGKIKLGYFENFPFQIGYAFYLFLVMKLTNSTGVITLGFLNVIWNVLTIYICYKISKEIFNEKAARITSIILCFFIPYIISIPILLNEILANLLYITAIYLCINGKQYIYRNYNLKWVLIGIILGLGHVIKQLTLVYLTAIILWCIINILKEKNKKDIIKNALTTFLIFKLIVFSFSYLFIGLGITDTTLDTNHMHTWRWLVATNYESNGSIGEYERELVSKLRNDWNGDYNKFNEVAELEIKRRLKEGFPTKLINLGRTKFIKMWGGYDTHLFWSTRNNKQAMEFYNYYLNYNDIVNIGHIQLIAIYLFSFMTCLLFIYKREFNHRLLLILISISGFVGGLLISEIQTRYRYSSIFLITILASYSIAYLSDYLAVRINNEGNRTFKKVKLGIGIIIIILIFSSIININSELKIKDVNIINEKNIYYFKPITNQDNEVLSYAWYIVKDNEVVEKNWYSTDMKVYKKVFVKPGQYKVISYVKNLAGKIKTYETDSIVIDEKDILSNKEEIHQIVLKKTNNEYFFAIDVPKESESLQYAWYIFKDESIYEKIYYKSSNYLEYEFKEPGIYKIRYFIKDDTGNKVSEFFSDSIIIE